MKQLEEKILKEGRILAGNVLKVDSFLNHQMDVRFLDEVGAEFYRLFKDEGVAKILTIEASGIGVACLAARHFDVPVVFAKKSKSSNIADDVYTARVDSYTHNTSHDVIVSRNFLQKGERVLIIDDFLARGNALQGLVSICRHAGCEVVGAGIVIEKVYQGGGNEMRRLGVRVESLARIASMNEGVITFEN